MKRIPLKQIEIVTKSQIEEDFRSLLVGSSVELEAALYSTEVNEDLFLNEDSLNYEFLSSEEEFKKDFLSLISDYN